jgi:O-antigen chain-terminating methyltransferase
VDIGCGRGEMLDLLRSSGVDARGIDTNAAMVDACRSRDCRRIAATPSRF